MQCFCKASLSCVAPDPREKGKVQPKKGASWWEEKVAPLEARGATEARGSSSGENFTLKRTDQKSLLEEEATKMDRMDAFCAKTLLVEEGQFTGV